MLEQIAYVKHFQVAMIKLIRFLTITQNELFALAVA